MSKTYPWGWVEDLELYLPLHKKWAQVVELKISRSILFSHQGWSSPPISLPLLASILGSLHVLYSRERVGEMSGEIGWEGELVLVTWKRALSWQVGPRGLGFGQHIVSMVAKILCTYRMVYQFMLDSPIAPCGVRRVDQSTRVDQGLTNNPKENLRQSCWCWTQGRSSMRHFFTCGCHLILDGAS